MPSKSTTAPQAHRLTKPITPVMAEFLAFIKKETGYDADPMSVQLGSLLRPEFQRSRSAGLAALPTQPANRQRRSTGSD